MNKRLLGYVLSLKLFEFSWHLCSLFKRNATLLVYYLNVEWAFVQSLTNKNKIPSESSITKAFVSGHKWGKSVFSLTQHFLSNSPSWSKYPCLWNTTLILEFFLFVKRARFNRFQMLQLDHRCIQNNNKGNTFFFFFDSKQKQLLLSEFLLGPQKILCSCTHY